MLAAIEVKCGTAPGARGADLQGKLFDRGLHVKSTGDNFIIAPAFIATREHIDEMSEILRDALKE
jgi:beta-alanine--pyruvate transaminase